MTMDVKTPKLKKVVKTGFIGLALYSHTVSSALKPLRSFKGNDLMVSPESGAQVGGSVQSNRGVPGGRVAAAGA